MSWQYKLWCDAKKNTVDWQCLHMAYIYVGAWVPLVFNFTISIQFKCNGQQTWLRLNKNTRPLRVEPRFLWQQTITTKNLKCNFSDLRGRKKVVTITMGTGQPVKFQFPRLERRSNLESPADCSCFPSLLFLFILSVWVLHRFSGMTISWGRQKKDVYIAKKHVSRNEGFSGRDTSG